MKTIVSALALMALPVAFEAEAIETVGVHVSTPSLTPERVHRLVPSANRGDWLSYIARSHSLMDGDKAALRRERGGREAPPLAPKGPGGGAGMPLEMPPAWYAGPEARHVADNILSFQTPAGGWAKNQDRSGPLREPGQSWAAADVPWAARDIAGDPDWAFIGTIDNNGTTQELAFLARVQSALPGKPGDAYRIAIIRGIEYLLAAQYPSGGWPQVFPLMGGYHDAVTLNDGAMTRTLRLLRLAAARKGEFSFVPRSLATRADRAVTRGTSFILRAQVRKDGAPTIWAQQYDPLTERPTGARNWEPASLSADESAGLLVMLMQGSKPSRKVNDSICFGVTWLWSHALHDVEWPVDRPEDGRRLVARKGAPPIWARLYDPGTGKPIFGARDKTVHDTVDDLAAEIRNSYRWFGTGPAKAISAYRTWRATHKVRCDDAELATIPESRWREGAADPI